MLGLGLSVVSSKHRVEDSIFLGALHKSCMHVKLFWSCLTLRHPMDCGPPGSSVLGILQARILEWTGISSSRGIFLTQGSKLGLLHCRWILYCLSHQGSPAIRPHVLSPLIICIKTPSYPFNIDI